MAAAHSMRSMQRILYKRRERTGLKHDKKSSSYPKLFRIASRMLHMQPPEDCAISTLVSDFRRGDKAATARLTELLYPELRKIAAGHMAREKADHTWQPTVLVNELYLELLKVRELKAPPEAKTGTEKKAFLAFASFLMDRLLVQHARRLGRRVTKTELPFSLITPDQAADGLQAVRSALERLEAINPRLRTVVELRVFEGLTGNEIAARLDCTERTILRDWAFAKELLTADLGPRANT